MTNDGKKDLIVGRGNVSFGVMHIPDRQRPVLFVKRTGVYAQKVGEITDEAAFRDALLEIFDGWKQVSY